jgi:Putative Actinobacterial Holin-X, holin superfamily III
LTAVNRELEKTENSSWSGLITGICIDAAQLLAHELELAKLEMQSEIRSVKASIGFLLLGLSIATIGLLLILVMLAYLLSANTGVPLWGSFGIIGIVTFLSGVGFVIWANSKKAEVDLIPQRAAEAVKEDIKWIRSSIKTSRTGKKPVPH